MTPEQTFFSALASGQIPFGIGLLTLMALVIWKGGLRLDKLTSAVEALPGALAAHKVETATKIDSLAAHTTAEADRVIKVIEDRRISEFGEDLDNLKRAVSDPDLSASARRIPTGRHAAIR